MSMVMLRRSLDAMRMTILSYSGSVFFYGLLIALFFPAIRSNSAQIDKIIRSLPASAIRAMGVQNYSTFPHFMGGEFLNLIWPIIASVFVILAGSAVVAGEVEGGTVDLWLSVPVSRTRLLTSKLAAIFLGLCVLAVATDGALIVGARLIGAGLSAGGILALSVYLVLFPLVIGCFAAAISSLSSSRTHAAGIAAGVLVLSYLVWVVGLIGGRWSWLQHLSVFSLFHPQDALSNASISAADVLWLLAIGAACAAASLIAFQRRPTL